MTLFSSFSRGCLLRPCGAVSLRTCLASVLLKGRGRYAAALEGSAPLSGSGSLTRIGCLIRIPDTAQL